jgi:SAM-dependent methyltransferase
MGNVFPIKTLKIQITNFIQKDFTDFYESHMLETFGSDALPQIKGYSHGILQNYRPWEYDKVMKYGDFKPDDVVLDTGAMHTYFCLFLAQSVKKIYATDSFYWAKRDYLAKQHLLSAKEWMEYIKDRGEGKVICQEADVTKLSYSDNSYDKILSISTIEHVLEHEKAIREMARVLKKGGKLLLTTEFNFLFDKKYSEEDDSYYRAYNYSSLCKLISCSGLKIRSSLIVENLRLRFLRPKKKVNAFICLEKPF